MLVHLGVSSDLTTTESRKEKLKAKRQMLKSVLNQAKHRFTNDLLTNNFECHSNLAESILVETIGLIEDSG